MSSKAETEPLADARAVLSVSALNDAARDVLERYLGHVWVEGEISNLARPASGHIYFSLKDAKAQVRCAMFRNRNRALGFRPENGLAVLARGRVSLYTARGDFQLIVDELEPAGDGALRLRFEQLKQRLAAEGLFDAARKQPLPAWPRQIGVVTSPSGAAVRDVLHVLARRCPGIPVIVYPTAVQGESAARAIVAALAAAERRAECDVLLVCRGGGSLEDLWPFNEEIVARAIAGCTIPVVSGVGHEVDVTIADFVADLRAPTPSAAAEQVSPDTAELARRVTGLERRLGTNLRYALRQRASRLGELGARLVSPKRRLELGYQRTDELSQRLVTAMRMQMTLRRGRVGALAARVAARSPRSLLTLLGRDLDHLRRRLHKATLDGL
ncbi:MAG: exodeoxyribonuclease VII large subunit, partial [Gammaproteobacteria bacterium]